MQFILVTLSAGSFLIFGVSCLVAPYMRREFLRYGLEGFRPLVGSLQLLGSAGLLMGIYLPLVGRAAAGGLAVLMLLGVITRLKIHDTWWQTTPAAFYMLLNTWIAVVGYSP